MPTALGRPQGRRHRDPPGRAAHRHAPRRLRRRRGEGRAPQGRRPAQLRLGEGRRVAVVAVRQPQQGLRDARASASPDGAGAAEGAGGRRRRPDRELPARHHGALGPRLGGAVGDQPPPRHGAGDGLRPDRPLLRPPRLRHAGRVDERVRPPQRLPRRAADAAAAGPGRRRGGLRRRLRHPGRPPPPGRHRPGPGDRPGHLRAAVLDVRHPGAGLRPARRWSRGGRATARR